MERTAKDPAVSVIIPTRNRAGWLPRAVASVLGQTYPDFEIIIVDDGSGDSTAATVTGIKDPRVRYVANRTSMGAAAARNRGITMARGEYIGFLDDDDEWLPAKLQKQMDAFGDSPPSLGLVYTGSAVVSGRTGKILHVFSVHSPEHKDIDFLRTVTFSTSIPLIRKSCFHDVGLFDESLPGAQDRDMWIRLARRYAFACIPDVLVHRSVHGEQITCNLKIKIEAKERICRKYRDLLSAHPDIMADHLWKLGMLYCLDGRSAQGTRCFGKAIRQCPYNPALYKDLLMSLVAPGRHRRLLSATRIGTIDGIRLYY